jgi:hypothetical protein
MYLAPRKSMWVSGELCGLSCNRAEGGLGDQLITEVAGFCEDFSQPHPRF